MGRRPGKPISEQLRGDLDRIREVKYKSVTSLANAMNISYASTSKLLAGKPVSVPISQSGEDLVKNDAVYLVAHEHRRSWTSAFGDFDLDMQDTTHDECEQLLRYEKSGAEFASVMKRVVAATKGRRFVDRVWILSHNGHRSSGLIRNLLQVDSPLRIDLYVRDHKTLPPRGDGEPDRAGVINVLDFYLNLPRLLSLHLAHEKTVLRVFSYEGNQTPVRAACFGNDVVAHATNSQVGDTSWMRGHPEFYEGYRLPGRQLTDIYLRGHSKYETARDSILSKLDGGSDPLNQIKLRMTWSKESGFKCDDLDVAIP